jgi:hypothetical protein
VQLSAAAIRNIVATIGDSALSMHALASNDGVKAATVSARATRGLSDYLRRMAFELDGTRDVVAAASPGFPDRDKSVQLTMMSAAELAGRLSTAAATGVDGSLRRLVRAGAGAADRSLRESHTHLLSTPATVLEQIPSPKSSTSLTNANSARQSLDSIARDLATVRDNTDDARLGVDLLSRSAWELDDTARALAKTGATDSQTITSLRRGAIGLKFQVGALDERVRRDASTTLDASNLRELNSVASLVAKVRDDVQAPFEAAYRSIYAG